MKKLVKDWLSLAEKDLKAAQIIVERDDDLTNVVCFHCQQCLEKLLKASLIANNEDVPRTHNLLKLYGMAREKLKIAFDMTMLEMINDIYTDARYPSDLGLLPDGLPSKEKARQFCDFTKDIYLKIKESL